MNIKDNIHNKDKKEKNSNNKMKGIESTIKKRNLVLHKCP